MNRRTGAPQGLSEALDSTLVGPGVSALAPHPRGRTWEEVTAQLDLPPHQVVLLRSNQNPLGASPMAVEAAGRALEHAHRYSDPWAVNLTRRLAERHDVPEDHIVVGNGSNELVDLLVRTFVQPGETVVCAWPSYVVYRLAAQAMNREGLVAPLRSDRIDLATLAGLVDRRTKLVFLANPNNPTGTYVRRRELLAFLDRIPPHVIVVLDEAYFEYATAPDFPDGIDALRSRPRVVVLRTFSKIFGLAGLRIGYGVMDPTLAHYLHATRAPFNVNAVAQAAARAALDDVDHVERSQRLVHSEMPAWIRSLSGLGLQPLPSQGNFLCVRCPFDVQPLVEALGAQGLWLGALHGYDLPDCFRTVVSTSAVRTRLIGALQAYLDGSA
ncbi:MAG TPA: histidinol-phosphate transaminase [Myxococcales bacterium LLY-WYZ-16_1]|nr:histidinol-phosphate transaminase [Myxococcales bacterium LLY-WYZ-16_1]